MWSDRSVLDEGNVIAELLAKIAFKPAGRANDTDAQGFGAGSFAKRDDLDSLVFVFRGFLNALPASVREELGELHIK